MRTVAILCAASKSHYSKLPGVEVFDEKRGAMTFQGNMPIVAHPPCRAWSRHCSHQAIPEPGEMELGLWCAVQVQQCGGVLEQPAGSRLFAAAGLPLPGQIGNGFTLAVCQCWWGYSMLKKTWLYFSRIPMKALPHVPFKLHAPGYDRRREQLMSHRQRSETCLDLAKWLVEAARRIV